MNTTTDTQLSSSKHHPRKSLVLLVFRIFLALLTIGTLYSTLIVFLLYSNVTDMYGHALVFGGLWIVHTVQFIAQATIVLLIVLRWATDGYYLSERQLFHYQGIWHMDERVYELEYVKSVKLYQSIFGKLFNYGTITLTLSAPGYNETLKLYEFTNPKKYERIFRNFMEPPR